MLKLVVFFVIDLGAMETGVFKFKNLTLGYDKPLKIAKIHV